MDLKYNLGHGNKDNQNIKIIQSKFKSACSLNKLTFFESITGLAFNRRVSICKLLYDILGDYILGDYIFHLTHFCLHTILTQSTSSNKTIDRLIDHVS